MNPIEKALLARLRRELPDLAEVTPGLLIDVHRRGRRTLRLAVGKTYDFYDLASLTKILLSTSASIFYFSESGIYGSRWPKFCLGGARRAPRRFACSRTRRGLIGGSPIIRA